MSYRAWPAALMTGTALTVACVVVGEYVVQTSDGCLDSAGWFTATPAVWPDNPAAGKHVVGPDKPGTGTPRTGQEVTETSEQRDRGNDQISGCLDLERIEIPVPTPAPDGRA